MPKKGANKKKYQKRLRPDANVQNRAPDEEVITCGNHNAEEIAAASGNLDVEEIDLRTTTRNTNGEKLPASNGNTNAEEVQATCGHIDAEEVPLASGNIDSGDELPDLIVEQSEKGDRNPSMPQTSNVTDDVTDSVTDNNAQRNADLDIPYCTWANPVELITVPDSSTDSNPQVDSENDDDVEIIEVCERASKEFLLSGENLARQLQPLLPPLKKWKHAWYCPAADSIDTVAQHKIPSDGPRHLTAVATKGDGNCLCRAVCKGYFNDDSKHVELRVRIVMEGVLNKEKYLSDEFLQRGATCIHSNANLPTVFTTFSEYYMPGQRVTEDAISCIYSMEIHECARLGTYMGLWQLAQASSVLGVPIHTVYPHRSGGVRNDFHRMFFPVDTSGTDDEPLVIM